MPTIPVGFRLDASNHSLLKIVSARNNMSPGEYARSLVLNDLGDLDRLSLVGDIHQLRQQIAELRKDIALSTELIAIVSCSSGVERPSTDEIKNWVLENLSRSGW
jgi:hypothetical protein